MTPSAAILENHGLAIEFREATPDVLAAAGVEIEHHWIAEEVYSKRAVVQPGAILSKHIHPFDHASALIRGTVTLEIDGVSQEITGPRMLLVEAGKFHTIRAVTEVVWHCIHITSDTDPDSVDATILKG